MPYIADDQDKQNQAQGAPDGSQAPIATSEAPAGTPGPSAGGKNAASNANPPQPFQNLQAYLSANQPQIQQQADKISGDLGNQYGQTVADINKAGTDFGIQVQGGYAPVDQNIVKQASANPTDFAKDPNNVAAFQKQWKNTYTGPTSFEGTGGYGDINKEVENAASNANLVNTPSGIQTYLHNAKGGMTTEGGDILDSALLRGSPQAITQVQNAAKPFTTLGGYLNNTVGAADQGVQDAIKAANAGSQGLQNEFVGEGGIVPTFKSGITNGVSEAQQQATGRVKAAQDALANMNASTNISDQTLADIGMTRDQYNTFVNQQSELSKGYTDKDGNHVATNPLDISKYANYGNPITDINTSNFSTPEQYAEAAALSKLTGEDFSGLFNPADQANAGKANLDLSNIDIQNLINDLSSSYGGLQNLKGKSVTQPSIPTSPTVPTDNSGNFDLGKNVAGLPGNVINSLPSIPSGNSFDLPTGGVVGSIVNPIGSGANQIIGSIGDAIGMGGGSNMTPEQRQQNELNDVMNQINAMPNGPAKDAAWANFWAKNKLSGGATGYVDKTGQVKQAF